MSASCRRCFPAFVLAISVALLWAAPSLAQEEGLLFRASFDESIEAEIAGGGGEPIYSRGPRTSIVPGRIGNAVSVPRRAARLQYHGPGSAFTEAGTLAFFWRMDEAPGDRPFVVADLPPLQRQNYGRWLRLRYTDHMLHLYFTPMSTPGSFSRAAVVLVSPQIRNALEADRWYHVAVTWDQTRGVGLYFDGELLATYDEPWHFEGQITRVSLGATGGVDRPGTAGHPQSFDEARVYDRWLDGAAIGALARGESPALGPRDLSQTLAHRRRVMGWGADMDASGLPTVVVGPALIDGTDVRPYGRTTNMGGLGLRQAGVDVARDVLRRNWHVFSGQRGMRWPGRVGYSDGGRQLDIQMAPGESFDVVQLFGAGPLAFGAAPTNEALRFDRILLRVDSEELSTYRSVLPAPETAANLALRRGGYSTVDRDQVTYPVAPPGKPYGGLAFELGLFERVPFDVRALLDSRSLRGGEAGWGRYALRPVAEADLPVLERDTLREYFAPLDRAAVVADAETGGAALELPALRRFHVFGPAAAERVGFGAVALDLQVEGPARPAAMRVEVFDPITRKRQWTSVDAALSGEAPGRLRLSLDIRDQVLPAGARPWVALTFSDDVSLGTDSAVSFRRIPAADALPQHRHEQLARLSDEFQELSESRPWGWRSQRVEFVRGVTQDLFEQLPDDELVASYWHWIRPGEPKPVGTFPDPPEGLPAWAAYLDESIERMKQVPYWWIENRENAVGEFGANDGINDDTVLVQDWWALHLMRGPDSVLADSVRRVADRSWAVTQMDGLSHRNHDPLHMYEWGMNAQSHMAVMDYGNPVYLARLMATVRQYERLTEVDEDGRRRFRSSWYGARYVDMDRRPGDSHWNVLALHPALMLAWYNGHPYATRVISEWADGMLADSTSDRRSILSAIWAAYELTGERRFLDHVAKVTDGVHDRFLAEAGEMDEALAARFVQEADALEVGARSLHNNNYRDLDRTYLAWLATGDRRHIEHGLMLTLFSMDWAMPMFTVGEQSTDRVWLPQRLANRVALGGPAMLRNELYPKHAVSWENATGRVAPFVRHQDRQSLDVWVANLEGHETRVDMRLWRLEHGMYDIAQGPDAEQRGEFDAPPAETRQRLARYGVLPLTLPPRSVWRLTAIQAEQLPDVRDRPDLAVAVEDAFYNYDSGGLTFQVHNIGARPTGPYRVRVRAGGRVLLDRQMPSLDPSADLWPSHVGVKVWDMKPYAEETITIELDPEDEIEEITTVNNTLQLRVSDLAGHDTLR